MLNTIERVFFFSAMDICCKTVADRYALQFISARRVLCPKVVVDVPVEDAASIDGVLQVSDLSVDH